MIQAYSWDCECGHLYSVTDDEKGSWYGRAAVDAEIKRLSAALASETTDALKKGVLNYALSNRVELLRSKLETIAALRTSQPIAAELACEALRGLLGENLS